MKFKRWQVFWTLLCALWLAAWAVPMAILTLRGDTEQLSIYFGMWVAVVLIPTFVVYVIGFLFGTLVTRSSRNFDKSRPMHRKSVWILSVIGWALFVGICCVMVRGPVNPFYHFAMPLAVAVVLLIVILPPTVLYAAGLVIDRIRRKVGKR